MAGVFPRQCLELTETLGPWVGDVRTALAGFFVHPSDRSYRLTACGYDGIGSTRVVLSEHSMKILNHDMRQHHREIRTLKWHPHRSRLTTS
jgi:hypothetical protein